MKKLEDMDIEELWRLFPIILKEHNPDYESWYAEEKQKLLHILQDYGICRINHIGSTSVEGLIAKPIIDILLELPDFYDLDGVAKLLQNNGWIVMARDDAVQILDLNKGYTPNGFGEKVFHLHVKPWGDWDELYFRDHLLQFPDVAFRYGILKQNLRIQFEHNRDAYTNEKTDFIRTETEKAREAFAGRYLPITI